MKKATINISYDEEKLNAMKLYLEQKGTSDLILETDKEIFNNALAGKAIDFESEDETDDFTMQM